MSLLLHNLGEKLSPLGYKGKERTEVLIESGLGIADAAHIVYAEMVGAELVSCDDKLIKKSTKLEIAIWAGSPIMFCDKEELK